MSGKRKDEDLIASGHETVADAPASRVIYGPVAGVEWGGGYRGGPVGSPTAAMDVLWRYKWSLVAVFVLIVVPAVALVWLLVVSEYRASAQVRVRPIIPRLVFQTEDNGLIPLYQSYLNTQVSVIRSPVVLQRVLDRQEIQKTAWYGRTTGFLGRSRVSPVERLLDGLKVRPRGRTEVIDITMTTQNPRDAAAIVNAVLEEYLKVTRERADRTQDMLYRKLVREYNSLRSEIEGRERVVAELRKELGTANPDELISKQRLRLDNMEAELKLLRRKMAVLKWHYQRLQAGASESPAAEGMRSGGPSGRNFQADTEWRRLYLDAMRARKEVEFARSQLGDAHPRLMALVKRAELAEELLRAREEQLASMPSLGAAQDSGAAAGPQLQAEGAALLLARLKYEEQILVSAIEKEKSRFNQMFDAAQLLTRETEALQHARDLYEAVRTRLAQKEMERNVPGSVEVLARAFVPSEPYRDRRVIFSFLSLMVAMAISAAVAYLRAITSQNIHGAQDLPPAMQTPFLGHIPLVRAAGDVLPEDSEVLAEYVRMVRTALLQRLDEDGGNAVLITSAGPGAGKTTVAIALARSFARCGKRALLIDADLQNPALGSKFGFDGEEDGFLSVLSGSTADADAIRDTQTPGLDVLPAGKVLEGVDSELLANGAFKAWLDIWKSRYDVIMLDGSPVLPVADARIMARQVDGAVLVVRESHCKRSDVADAMSCLNISGAKLLGLVFIGRARIGAYWSGHYRRYRAAGGLPVRDT